MVGATKFDRAKWRPEVRTEWEARGLVHGEVWRSWCFGVTWHAQIVKWQGNLWAGGWWGEGSRRPLRLEARSGGGHRGLAAGAPTRPGPAAGLEVLRGGLAQGKREVVRAHPDRRQEEASRLLWSRALRRGGRGAGFRGHGVGARAGRPVGWSTNNASERTKFEMMGQRVRGLSREHVADVEAWLEWHLRRVLLACKAGEGRQRCGGGVRAAAAYASDDGPSRPWCPPAKHGASARTTWHAETLRPGMGVAGLVGASRAAGAGRRWRAGRRGNDSQHVSATSQHRECNLKFSIKFRPWYYQSRLNTNSTLDPKNI